MNYIIYENGREINRIGASEAFVVAYCEKHGYTYAPEPDQSPEPPPEPSLEEIVNTILGVD